MAKTIGALTMEGIAELIQSATHRVTLAAPGIDGAVASALALAAGRLPQGRVQVILDVAENNVRVGYGNELGYATLVDGKVPIRRCPGLRIGFLLADDEGHIFGEGWFHNRRPSRSRHRGGASVFCWPQTAAEVGHVWLRIHARRGRGADQDLGQGRAGLVDIIHTLRQVVGVKRRPQLSLKCV